MRVSITAESRSASHAIPAIPHQFNIVQALRLLAAFAVVVLHCSFYTSERLDPGAGIYASGANGVRLFFVISGFVMILSSRSLSGLRNGWSIFAIRRIVRIVPLYWAVTTLKLLMLLATPAVVLHAAIDWRFIVKSYLFIPATNVDGELHPLLGVGWTLNFEMMFYALFTVALALRLRPIVALAPILLLVALLSTFRTPAWPDAARFWCDPIVLDFLVGMIIGRAVLAGYRLPAAAGWILLIAGLAFLALPIPKPDYLSLTGSLTRTVAAGAVVLGAVAMEPRTGHAVPRWMLVGGAASYALYLIHPLVAPAVPAIFAKLGLRIPLASVVLSVAVALVAGMIVYRFVERPLTRMTDRLIGRTNLLVKRPRTATVRDMATNDAGKTA